MNSLLPVRRSPNPDDNLIPLINIVFLLLIFFMIAGQIDQFSGNEIVPPTSGSDTPIPVAPVVIELLAEGQLRMKGDYLTPESLATELPRLGELSGLQISIRADAQARARDLDALLMVLREQHIQRVSLVTRQQEGE